MGDASARIEEQIGAPALYVNGAVGDVSPRQRGWDGVASTGKLLSAAVRHDVQVRPVLAMVVDDLIVNAMPPS